MASLTYKRLCKVLQSHRKLVLYRYENGLPQARECDQERRASLIEGAGKVLDMGDGAQDIDAEELNQFLYQSFRTCPPGDLLLLSETMYGDALDRLLEESDSELAELGVELVMRLGDIMKIQYEVHEVSDN